MEAIKLFIKGACMGVSDTLPGISGGTIALVTGIYDRLIDAINTMITLPQPTGMHSRVMLWFSSLPWSFLIPVGLGVGVGIVGAAFSITALLLSFASPTYSAFIGLLVATVVVLLMRLRPSVITALCFFAGLLFTFIITSLWSPTLPTTLGGMFFAGMLAAGIMLVPGPSGAYMLLITGVYTTILTAVQNPLQNIATLLVFACGAIIGLLSVARILGLLLKWSRAPVLALLAGFVAGSLHLLGDHIDPTYALWNVIAVVLASYFVISIAYWSAKKQQRNITSKPSKSMRW